MPARNESSGSASDTKQPSPQIGRRSPPSSGKRARVDCRLAGKRGRVFAGKDPVPNFPRGLCAPGFFQEEGSEFFFPPLFSWQRASPSSFTT